jgi:hypothetical protein
MLALDPTLVYVHEPFNMEHPPPLSTLRAPHWYLHLTAADAAPHERAVRRVMELRYPVERAWTEPGPWRARLRHLMRAWRYARHRWAGRVPLVKDPLALLSAEWLADRFDARVVVTIRHPLAFAGSLKEKGWTFPFDDLLAQPHLMRGPLRPFQNEIEAFAAAPPSVVDQAALLWTLLYTVVAAYRERRPDWIFVRHEDLARAPREGFAALYDRLDLPFTAEVEHAIRAHSAASNPVEVATTRDVQRHSQALLHTWKDRLTDAEAAHVRARTARVADLFYPASPMRTATRATPSA